MRRIMHLKQNNAAKRARARRLDNSEKDPERMNHSCHHNIDSASETALSSCKAANKNNDRRDAEESSGVNDSR